MKLSRRPIAPDRLTFVRALTMAVALAALALFLAGLPGQFRAYQALADIGAPAFQSLAKENLAERGLTPSFYAAFNVTASALFALVCAVVAAIIFRARSQEVIAQFVALMLVLLGTTFATINVAAETGAIWGRLSSLIDALSVATVALFFYIFPNGRFVPRWSRWPASLLAAYIVVTAILPTSNLNPDRWPREAYALFLLAWVLAGIAAQVYRYRRVSTTIERQQARWVVFGFSLALIGYAAIVLVQVFSPEQEPGTWVHLGSNLAALAAMSLIPISIGVAILRYRLFDINFFIRRTITYAVLSFVLALVYYAGVGVMQTIFTAAAGENPSVVVLPTLLVAALFTPLRRRFQGAIDRRFFRRRYDPQQVLSRFGAIARDETDVTAVAAGLQQVVAEAIQPAHVSIWLRS